MFFEDDCVDLTCTDLCDLVGLTDCEEFEATFLCDVVISVDVPGLDETGTEVEGLVSVAMTGTDDCEFTALPLERGALVC